MKTAKFFGKSAKAIVVFLVAALIVCAQLPFAALAAVDDFIEQGNLIYLVTEEGSASALGKVTAAFNENLDPATVTGITVPATVENAGRSYRVTALSGSAFGGCVALKTLDLSACTALGAIGESSFLDCEKLTSIVLPCGFNKDLFADTGVVPDGDKFTIEYAVMGEPPTTVTVSSGQFSYVHHYTVNHKNYAEHKCSGCGRKESHKWVLDNNNTAQHKCTVCGYTETHYGGNADCDGEAVCVACGSTYKTAAGKHHWEVVPETIGATSANYSCTTCEKVEKQQISADKTGVNYNEKTLNIILQDPYKVLPDGTTIEGTPSQPGDKRYNELMAQLDNTNNIERLAFFELELFDAQSKSISGKIGGSVRVLIQIPDGWDKNDLEAVLIMTGADSDFEESVITIDGVDYLAFWTDHFSPYALIDKKTAKENKKTSPATGNSDFVLISALAAVSASAVIFIYLIIERKRKKA